MNAESIDFLGLFQQHCRTSPDAPAVATTSIVVSYRELEQRALAIAARLAAAGVGAGDRVVLWLPKSVTAYAALLGLLRLGAVYVPLEPRTPLSRLESALSVVQPRALLVEPAERQRLEATNWGQRYASLCVEIGASPTGADPLAADASALTEADGAAWQAWPLSAPAAILMTSGSTGRPKGVVLSRGAIDAFTQWACHSFELGPQDRVANFSALGFDLSLFDLFASWSVGACVLLVTPDMVLQPAVLMSYLQQRETTTLYTVPSTLTLLREHGGLTAQTLPSLRQVLYAGEPFPVHQLRALMHALPSTPLFNLFGPTETNVCTYHPLQRMVAEDESAVPIGRLCSHLEGELLDEQGQPVLPGQEGELCIAGPTVMQGYFGEPERTAAAFWPPGISGAGPRYRTGDFVREDEEGVMWFIGRRDRLLKRRGYRIELGDVEAAMARLEPVREVAVGARADDESVEILAFVVLREGAQITALTLRADCGSLLVPTMVPDRVIVVESLPRTPNGKVDLSDLLAAAPRFR